MRVSCNVHFYLEQHLIEKNLLIIGILVRYKSNGCYVLVTGLN